MVDWVKLKNRKKHKNLKDKTKVTNKDAKKDEQKISIKNREAGAYRIQLASLAKRQAAEKFLKKVRTKNANLLGRNEGARYEDKFKIKRNFLSCARWS